MDGRTDPWMVAVELRGRAATACHGSMTRAGSGIPGDVLTGTGVHDGKPGGSIPGRI